MIRASWRALRLAWHLTWGLLVVLIVFPGLDPARRWRRVHGWAAGLLHILHIKVRLMGTPPALANEQGGVILVANHVSWLDIHLLHSRLPARFISKAEVRGWPLIGRLAEACGTLFLERSRKSDAARVNRLMAAHLAAGDCLAFFPEGTTSDGQDLRPFFPSLFQPAVESGTAVWPVLLRYLNPDGTANLAAAYFGEMSLLQSLRQVLRQPRIIAELRFLPAIASQGLHRRELAAQVEAAMRQAWADAGRGRPPDTADHPPAGRR